MPDYLIGLDLGQSSDPTALAVLKRSLVLDGEGRPTRDHRGEALFHFVCVHLERYPLGTSYPEVVARVSALVREPRLQPDPWVAVDATGVGRAVFDLFLNERMPARLVAVTITAGDTLRRDRWNRSACFGYWVPKTELVSAVQAGLQSRQLKVVPSLPLADTLRSELADFRVTLTASANETFGAREGAHDDLVLSVALPLWLGGRRETEFHPRTPAGGDPDERALAHDSDRERDALARAEADARRNEERQWLAVENEALWQ
jgi:hypothetical protein